MPKLLIEKGTDRGREVSFVAGENVVIGRDEACGLQITDPLASRKHCLVGEKRGVWLVKDLESANGTHLNGRPLGPAKAERIESGNTIQIGDTIIAFFATSSEGEKDDLIGSELGGYRIDGKLGRGAMGVVYRAHQMRLGREVALKVLSKDLSHDEKFKEMFFREARAAAAFNHMNILQVYDVGEDAERDHVYMSMEIAPGGSVLEELRSQGSLPLDRTIQIVRDVLTALEYAEKKGIVHRDIKPDNLMIGSDGVVKLGDLGLATSAAELANPEGGVFGTPHYIAPEQAQGKAVDHRADLYALGATWFRMLAGRTLFVGGNVRDILRSQVRDPHTPIKDIVHDCPAAIAAIIDRMLAKEPALRYQSATDVLADINSFLTNRNASSAAMSMAQAPKGATIHGQSARPKPIGMYVGIGLGVLAVVGVGIAIAMGGGEPTDPTPPVSNGTNGGSANPNGGNGSQSQGPSERDIEARLKLATLKEDHAKAQTTDAQALERVREWLVVYDGTPSSEEAKAFQTQLEAAVARIAGAVTALESEWTALTKSIDDVDVPGLQLKAASTKVATFVAKLDERTEQAVKDLKTSLAPEAYLATVRGNVLQRVDQELAVIVSPLTERLDTLPPDAQVRTLEAAVSALEKLVSKPDDDEIRAPISRAYETWKGTLDLRRAAVERAKKEAIAAQARALRAEAMSAIRESSSHAARLDFTAATAAIEKFALAAKERIDANATEPMFTEVALLIADAREQYAMEQAALKWLAKSWTMQKLEDLSSNPVLAAAFPDARAIRLHLFDSDLLAYRLDIQTKSGQLIGNTDPRGQRSFRDDSVEVFAALLNLAIEKSKLSAQLDLDANIVHKLGIASVLMERCWNQLASGKGAVDESAAALAFSLARQAYDASKASPADDPRRRKAWEFTAQAILLRTYTGSARDRAAYLAMLRSQEFVGSRAELSQR